jgi:hypothetical protein
MHKRQSDIYAADHERTPIRTFERDGKWYFSSREGDFGPFDNEATAQDNLDSYVGLIDLRPELESPVTPD